jgi:hypothetical protein
MSSTIFSSNPSPPPEERGPEEEPNTTPKAPLALPAAPSNTTQLDMSNGSTTVSLDHLGPMVVNVDGTMSRISNWDKMAEIEKTATLRIIGKRNKRGFWVGVINSYWLLASGVERWLVVEEGSMRRPNFVRR